MLRLGARDFRRTFQKGDAQVFGSGRELWALRTSGSLGPADSPTRTGGDRSLAGGLQHRALAQLAKVSDAGRIRRKRGSPSMGKFGCAGTPEC
jgi:hypothetical protein